MGHGKLKDRSDSFSKKRGVEKNYSEVLVAKVTHRREKTVSGLHITAKWRIGSA
jgi:hypothetical protein